MPSAMTQPSTKPSLRLARQPAREAALELANVSKTYGSGAGAVHALRGVDLHIGTGSLSLIAGPSGSGKSTLLSVLGCLMQPSAGSVRVFGEALEKKSESHRSSVRRANFGFVFQGIHLLPALSGLENVLLAGEIKGLPATEEQAQLLMARVGVGDLHDRLPKDMSGGQRQRVAIARALFGKPRILLADEPTAALDRRNAAATLELLSELSRSMDVAVIVVSHDRSLFHYADRLLELEDGRLKE